MRSKYLFAVFSVIFFYNTQAQLIDEMEYPNGMPLASWWDCTLGCPIIVGPNGGHNSDYSGFISDDQNLNPVLNLGNKIFGPWWLHFFLYIPSDKEAVFNLQGEVPVTTGESIVGNFIFNPSLASPGQGYIDANTIDPSDDTYFDFPHDQWFRVVMAIDMDLGVANATWILWVNNIQVVEPGTPFADGNGNTPSHLGGVSFFANSADNSYYFDDIIFSNAFVILAGINETSVLSFSVFPNPVNDNLNILSKERIEEIRIYDLRGKLLHIGFSEKKVDVSNLQSGLYFIELNSEQGRSIQKFIKK